MNRPDKDNPIICADRFIIISWIITNDVFVGWRLEQSSFVKCKQLISSNNSNTIEKINKYNWYFNGKIKPPQLNHIIWSTIQKYLFFVKDNVYPSNLMNNNENKTIAPVKNHIYVW